MPFETMKIILVLLTSMLGLATVTEIGLRLTMGLGNPPLYIADREIGYLLAPNQKLRRSGNLIETNQYSMRNQQIEPEKAANTQRILFLGDSIVNGSWWTDQVQTLPALVEQKLQQTNKNKSVEVLNASANSWGTRNELAYLKRFGLFDADTLVLVINTDDLLAGKPTSLVVGNSRNYPKQAPPLALIELFQLYLVADKPIPELEKLRESEQNKVEKNLVAIKKIKQMAETADTRFILAMTPLLREFQSGGTDQEIEARKRFEELVTTENIEYLNFLEIWSDFPQPEFLYRDHIHPNLQGNTKITEAIAQFLVAIE